MARKKYEFKVTVPKVEGVSEGEIRAYLEEAANRWCKGSNPNYPIFWAWDDDPITVKRLVGSKK